MFQHPRPQRLHASGFGGPGGRGHRFGHSACVQRERSGELLRSVVCAPSVQGCTRGRELLGKLGRYEAARITPA